MFELENQLAYRTSSCIDSNCCRISIDWSLGERHSLIDYSLDSFSAPCGSGAPRSSPFGATFGTPFGTPGSTPGGTPFCAPFGAPFSTPFRDELGGIRNNSTVSDCCTDDWEQSNRAQRRGQIQPHGRLEPLEPSQYGKVANFFPQRAYWDRDGRD